METSRREVARSETPERRVTGWREGVVAALTAGMVALALAGAAGGADPPRAQSRALDPARLAGPLDLEARAVGMAAVARARFLRRGGDPAGFDTAYPPQWWRRAAEDVVQASRCLLERYRVAIDDGVLERELGRMLARTRDPEGLAELVAALEGDPFLVKECLVRPALVRRQLWDRIAWDGEIHGRVRDEASRLGSAADAGELESLGGGRSRRLRLDRGAGLTASGRQAQEHGRVHAAGITVEEEARRILVHALDAVADGVVDEVRVELAKTDPDEWWAEHAARFSGELPEVLGARGVTAFEDLAATVAARAAEQALAGGHESWQSVRHGPRGRTGHTAVWTGSEMVVWGGSEPTTAGWRYDPALDRWIATASAGAPTNRVGHTAVWTGTEMLVWGGETLDGAYVLSTGGRYDPVQDRWSHMSTSGAPPGVRDHTAVWTGSEMIVWGGVREGEYSKLGGAYDPVANRWRMIQSVQGVPTARALHTAVWTGSEMVVWGGFDGHVDLDDGSRYDPVGDRWQRVTRQDGPSRRRRHWAVWTGTEMLVCGGTSGSVGRGVSGQGGRYDPEHDRWAPIQATVPVGARAAWTGREVISWGDQSPTSAEIRGARYVPDLNRWTSLTAVAAPDARADHTIVWTGQEALVWGGSGSSGLPLETGGAYDPASEGWRPLGGGGEPANRTGHTAIWTGIEMLVWGGRAGDLLGAGGRYEPATDSWSLVTVRGECAPRHHHVSVWSGRELIVWGGVTSDGVTASGCAYSPVTDRWRRLPEAGAPSRRYDAGAVWTGDEMIVWGGRAPGGPLQANGARYSPAADRWRDVSLDNAPPTVGEPALIWTGSEMLAWGLVSLSPWSYGGRRYDPVNDLWRRMGANPGPSASWWLPHAWTGRELVFFAGQLWDDGSDQAARYHPGTDRWSRLPSEGQPGRRSLHTVTAAGREVIVWGGRAAFTDEPIAHGAGARYDLLAERWRPVTEEGAPAGRMRHTAVWTGRSLLIWGGENGWGLDIYTPGVSAVRRLDGDVRRGGG